MAAGGEQRAVSSWQKTVEGLMAGVDEKLDRLLQSVQELNVKVEQLRVGLEAAVRAKTDHEERLRVLERWQNKMTPLLALVTFVLGAAFKLTLDRL